MCSIQIKSSLFLFLGGGVSKTPVPHNKTRCLCLSSAGTLHGGVQVQRVGVRELLRHLLVHAVQTTGVGESLVPRAQ